MEHGITPLRQVELIELFVRSINDWLIKIKKYWVILIMKTTENYLDSLEKEVKKEYANKLTAFKNITIIN